MALFEVSKKRNIFNDLFSYRFQAILFIYLSTVLLNGMCAPLVEPWPRWFVYNSNSHLDVYQRPWQQFLDRYVITNALGVNIINYGHISSVDQYSLTAYLAELSQIPVSKLSRPQQLAFWVNLYNALVVATILRYYPVNSITDIDLGSEGPKGPWDAQLIKVEGIPLSLNDIENRILRPIWSDPRIHYVLSCGAISCPNLPRVALMGHNINALLDMAARSYINSSRAVRIENGQLMVSDLYIWYRQDFGGSDQSIINHLMQYANPKLRAELQLFHKIDHSFFDWTLNSR
jgi:hypothetical protein